jgi:gliding motility-associated-like protein
MKAKLLKIWLLLFLSILSFSSFSADRFWVGGTGNWNDVSHWSSESGGIGGVTIPSSTDNVFIDSKSFSAIGQSIIVSGSASCNNLTWTATSVNPELIGKSSSFIQINGSLLLTDTYIDSFLGTISFIGSTDNTIQLSKKIAANLLFNGSGSWTFLSEVSTSQNIKLQIGTVKTNNFPVFAYTFDGNGTQTRALLLGNSVVTVNSWLFGTTTNLTFEGLNAKIIVLGDWTKDLQRGNLSYGTLTNSDKRALTIDSVVVKPYNCDGTGKSKGKVSVYVSGATSPYNFRLYKDGISKQYSSLKVSPYTFDTLAYDPSLGYTYSVDVSKGVTTVSKAVTYPVSWPTQMQVGVSVVKHVTCALISCDAQLSADPTGGVSPYTYKWLFTGNQTTKIATGVCNNISLAVEVTDANSCKMTGTINYYPGQPGYTGPRQLVFNPDPVANTPSCGSQNNGTISIKMTGGLGPRQFKLVSASLTDNRPYQADSNFANLKPGEIYTVWAKDSVGCELKSNNNITIGTIAEPIVNAGVDTTICADLTVNLNAVVATNCSVIAWTTSGDGTFSSSSIRNPIYTPGANDKLSGSVTLSIKGTGLAGCSQVNDSRIVSISPIPTVFAGPDQKVCLTGLTYALSAATAANQSSVTWTTKGDGTFSNPAIVQPSYTFKTADTTSKLATVILSVQGSGGCATRVVKDSLDFIMTVPPFVYAGPAQNMCKGTTYTASSASIHFYSSILWTSTGTGIFSSNSIEQPIYTPSNADKALPSVTLTAKAIANSPCVDATATVKLSFFDPPTILAGNDYTVCSNGSFTLTEPTQTFCSSLQWSTSGDGTFDDKTKIKPIYTPGSSDNALGSVTLSVTGTGTGGCSTSIVNSVMTLTMVDSAIASAGPDKTICKGSTISILGATAQNYSSLLWTTSGTGTLSSTFTLGTIYTPSPADKIVGSVILTLTAKGNTPCPDVQSPLTVNLTDQPTIELGPDVKVCSSGPYTLSPTTGSFYSALKWTTTGDGAYSNATILKPIYTPSTLDTTTNTVMLKLEATGTGGCSAMKVQDSVIVQFIDSPLANAGATQSICKGSSLTINDASAKNYSSLAWSTSGTGTFSSPSAVLTDYIPSVGDLALASVNVTLTAKAFSPCVDATSVKTINLHDQPTAFAGNDFTVCSKLPYTLASSTATNFNSILWSAPAPADGTFDNPTTLHPIYTPGPNDKILGSVVLKISVTGKLACAAVVKEHSMTLTMNDPPTVFAGADMDICKNKTIDISDATATKYASLLWSSSGTGSFTSPGALITTYNPSAADLTAGTVNLTLKAIALPSCVDIQDSKIVTLSDPVTANSGGSKTVCFSSNYIFATDNATNYKTLAWEKTAADGTFSDASNLHPTYTFGPNDLIAGFAIVNLKATGFANCDPVSSSMTITIDKGPQIDAGIDMEICYNGKATISGATGTPSSYASLLWTTSGNGIFDDATKLNPIYTPGPADLAAHTVKLTLTALGKSACVNAVDFMNITILPQLNVSINSGGAHPFSTKCFGGWDAEAHVVATGGNAPFTYKWNDVKITGKDTLLFKGTFVASVTDAKGCIVSNSIVITEPLKMTTSFTPGAQIKCNGDATASVTVNTLNGIGGYFYIWSNGDNVATATALTAGKKYVTVTDGNTCFVTDSTIITEPTKVTSIFITKLPNCPGDGDGSITAIASGGTVAIDYKYLWSNANTTNTISGLSTGTFSINIKDDNNCPYDTTFVLPDPQPLKVKYDVTNVKCYGDSTGQIFAHVTGGSKPYALMWTDITNSTDSLLKKLTITSLQLDVIDANGCELFDTAVTITQPPVFSVGVGKPTSFLVSATTKIAVTFKGKHDMIQDVGFNLVAPNGTIVTLSSSPSTAGSPNPACNVGRNFNINFTTEALSILDMCAIHPYGAPAWPAAWTDNNRIGWPENPAISGDFKPETAWNTIFGQDPSNGGWALEILDCFPLKIGEELDSSVWQNASLSFTDINISTGLLETITFQKSGMSTQIKNPTAAGCASTKFKIPLKMSTSCYGVCDAQGVMNPVGGLSPYSYAWSDPTIPNKDTLMLCAGNYTVTASDKNGCTAVGGVTIIQPTKIVMKLDSIANICYGKSTGQAIATYKSGGTLPLSFVWNSGPTTPDTVAKNLVAGKYFLTTTDDNNCHQIDSIVVRDSLKVLTNITLDSTLCSVSVDGAIHLAPFGVNIKSPFTYAWQTPPGGTGASLTNLASGTYTVTVKDAAGCQLDTLATVLSPLPLKFSSFILSPPTCLARSDASISISISGGSPAYSYKWKNAFWTVDSTRDKIESIKAGTYDLRVTDKNGCFKDTTFIVIDPTALSPTIIATDSVKCSGDATGTASVSVLNGTAPYSYIWSTGAILNNISGLIAGKYSVTISDKFFCTVTDSKTIKEPNALLVSTTIIDSVTCNGTSTAKFKVSTIGGSKPYSFIWNNAVTDSVVSSVKSGTYDVTVTDINNCINKAIVVITDPTKVSAVITFDSTKCSTSSDGALYLSPNESNIKAPFTYKWQTGGTDDKLINIVAGKYTVTVFDKKGCELDTFGIVPAPKPIKFSNVSISIPTCQSRSDATISLLVSDGTPTYTYKWKNAAWTSDSTRDKLESIKAGKYDLHVTDKYGCFKDTSFTISDPLVMITTITATDSVKCNGDATGLASVSVVNGTAPYSYVWSTGALIDNISGLIAGKYFVTITDKYACSVTDSKTIKEPKSLIVSTAIIDSITCNGTSTANFKVSTIGGSKPYSFIWNNLATDSVVTASPAGTYTVTVTDKNSCKNSTSVVVTEPSQLLISSINQNPSECSTASGKAYVTASGATKPYTYKWSNNGTLDTIKNVFAGDYTVTVTDKKGCNAASSIKIKDTTTLVIKVFPIQQSVSCKGRNDGSGYVDFKGGKAPYTITWSDASSNDTINKLIAGTYSVNVTDGFTCQQNANLVIDESNILTAAIDSIHDISCYSNNNGLLRVIANGGAASGGYSYKWNNAATTSTISGLTAAKYTVQVSDTSKCIVSVSHTLIKEVFKASFVGTKDIKCDNTCSGTSIFSPNKITGKAPFVFVWENGETDSLANALCVGTNTVIVTDKNGCTYTDSIAINDFVDPLTITVDTAFTPCGQSKGKAVAHVLGGVKNYIFKWSNGITDSSNIAIPANIYDLTVTDANGCIINTSVSVEDTSHLPFATKIVKNESCLPCSGTAMVYNKAIPNAPGFTYKWSTGSTNDTLYNACKGLQTVRVTRTLDGCINTFRDTVKKDKGLVITMNILKAHTCLNSNDASAYVSYKDNSGLVKYKWSNGATDSSITNVGSGTYTVTVNDDLCSLVDTVRFDDPIKYSMSSTTVSCFNGSDGSASFKVLNALVPDSIIWNDRKVNSQKTPKAINLPFKMYTATVYYNNSCVLQDSVQVNQNSQLTVTWTVTNTICNSSVGKIIAKGKGGVPFADSVVNYKYKYRWHSLGMDSIKLPQYNNDTITSLGVDYYVLKVEDSLKCPFTSAPILLTDNGDITSSVDSIRFPTCPTINNGYYRIKPKSVNPPFTYGFWKYNTTITDSVGSWWSPARQTTTMGIADSLTPGSYKVYITNDNSKNCKQVVLFTIGTNYLNAVVTKKDVTCPLQPNGWAKVIASKGLPYLHQPKYRYKWSTGSTIDSIFGLAAGTYSVTVTDSINCTVLIKSVIINNPVMMTITLPSDTIQTTCYGPTAAPITAIVGGGQSPYKYKWDGTLSGASLNAGTAGWHYITVNDTGCFVANDSVLIEQKGHLKMTKVDTLRTLCGQSIGKITLHVDGTSTPIKFAWNTGATDSVISNLVVDYYSYTVTDAQNCTLSDTIKVEDSSTVQFKIYKLSDVHCAGKAIGIAYASDTLGGTKPYKTIGWENETFLFNTDNRWKADTLRAGIIEVRVIDSKGCTGLDRVRILVDSVLSLSFTNVIQDVSCPASPINTGHIQADVKYGKPIYSYKWNPVAPADTNILYNLAPGTYTVTVTDQNACEVTNSIVIKKAPLLVDSIKQTDATCFGISNGSIQVAPKDGLGKVASYNWSNGSSTSKVTGLAIGKYIVTITEATNACIAVDSFIINQPLQFNATYSTLKKTTCKDSTGIVKATITGGTKPYSYIWKGIVKPDTLSQTDTLINYWADYFRLFVTDANACPFIDSIRTTDTSLLSVQLLKITSVSCYGKSDGYLSVQAKDGFGKYSYKWTHDATILDSIAKNVKAGTYTVRVTDDSLCWRDYTDKVIQPDTLVLSFPYPTKITCFGGTDTVAVAIIGGNGSNFVSWKNGLVALAVTDTIIPLATIGTYHVSVSDIKGCKADSSVKITQANPITLDSLVVNAGCGTLAASGTAKITAITTDYAPATFKWWDGLTDSLHTDLSKGTYDVIIKDAQKCIDTLKVTVKSEMFDSLRIDKVQLPKCNYNSPTGTLAARAYGSVLPYQWQWSRSIVDKLDTVKKVLPGKYYVTVTGKNGCTITDSATVTSLVEIEAIITTKTDNGEVNSIHFCKNDSTTLVGVGKHSIYYPPGKAPLPNERFLWGVKDGSTDELLATMSNNVGSEISVKPFQPTTYQMWYTIYGCSVPVKEVSLSYYDTIGLHAQIVKDGEFLHDTATIVKGYKIQLQPEEEPWFVTKDPTKTGFIEYTWNSYDSTMKVDGIVLRKILNEKDYAGNKSMALDVSPIASTWYVVVGKTNFGCYERDSVRIKVEPSFVIPSGISPNGDGINDKWNLPYLKQFPEARVTIFNRWGIIIWEKEKDYTTGAFEGKNKDGKELPLGTYYYLIEFNDGKGTKPLAGSLTIVR